MMLPEMKGVTTPGTQGTEKSHTEFKGKSVTFEMGLKGLVRIFWNRKCGKQHLRCMDKLE